MQYMLMIHEDNSYYEGENGEALMGETIAKHMQLAEDLTKAGVSFSGNRLHAADSATTIRWNNGEHALHDGAFAETHEELGGYYIIDVADLDAAVDWAKRIPVPGKGAVEVRPVFEMG